FRVGEQYAGKRVKCPKCGGAIAVAKAASAGIAAPRPASVAPRSASPAAGVPAPRKPVTAPAPKQRRPKQPQSEDGGLDLDALASLEATGTVVQQDDLELAPAPGEMKKRATPRTAGSGSGSDNACPSCGNALANGAVLCIACGCDLRSGKK